MSELGRASETTIYLRSTPHARVENPCHVNGSQAPKRTLRRAMHAPARTRSHMRLTQQPPIESPTRSSLRPPPVALHPCDTDVITANHLPIRRRAAFLRSCQQILLHHRRQTRPIGGADSQIE